METLTEILGLSVHDMGCMESSTRNQGMKIEQIRTDFESWITNHTRLSIERDEQGEYKDYQTAWWFKRWVDSGGMPK